MIDPKIIKDALETPLIEAGFKKKSNSWYWNNDDVVLLVNLQKSQYGDQYYVNCGVALKSLSTVDFPKEQHCHIRFRLTAIVSDDEREEIESMFDLENDSLSNGQRTDKISTLIRDKVLPILKRCSSIDGIAKILKNGTLTRAMVHKQVKDLVLLGRESE